MRDFVRNSNGGSSYIARYNINVLQLLMKYRIILNHCACSYTLGKIAEYYLLSSPVIQRSASTKEICERNADIVKRDPERNTL
jgi:hypothetical protein